MSRFQEALDWLTYSVQASCLYFFRRLSPEYSWLCTTSLRQTTRTQLSLTSLKALPRVHFSAACMRMVQAQWSSSCFFISLKRISTELIRVVGNCCGYRAACSLD